MEVGQGPCERGKRKVVYKKKRKTEAERDKNRGREICLDDGINPTMFNYFGCVCVCVCVCM